MTAVVHHRRIVNAMADALSAARTGHMRVSTASGPTASAALVPEACAAPLTPEPEVEPDAFVLPDGVEEGVVERVRDGEAEGVVAASVWALPELAPEAPEATEEPEHVGAATAVDGSVSAPVPKATGCPLNCSVCAAGVLEPSAPAMVNRPVHWTTVVAQDVNW